METHAFPTACQLLVFNAQPTGTVISRRCTACQQSPQDLHVQSVNSLPKVYTYSLSTVCPRSTRSLSTVCPISARSLSTVSPRSTRTVCQQSLQGLHVLRIVSQTVFLRCTHIPYRLPTVCKPRSYRSYHNCLLNNSTTGVVETGSFLASEVKRPRSFCCA